MSEKRCKIALRNQDTYVYIDVSNIRSACLKTLGLAVDFAKLIRYFQEKYPGLKEVRYYEGIAKGDMRKRQMFSFLRHMGYKICALERKQYSSIEIEEKDIECPRCGNKWTAKWGRERRVMKSNVDVFLASDMMVRASVADHPVRLILVSCDGDYAEAIKNAVGLNKNISIAVLATPSVSDMSRNTLSVRLKNLLKELPKDRYSLNYIDAISQKIKSDN